MRPPRSLSTRPMRIVPKLELRGTQLAGWTPDAGGRELTQGILFDEDVRIPLPDGVELIAFFAFQHRALELLFGSHRLPRFECPRWQVE